MEAKLLRAKGHRHSAGHPFIIPKRLIVQAGFLYGLLVLHLAVGFFPVHQPVADPELHGSFSILEKAATGDPLGTCGSTHRRKPLFREAKAAVDKLFFPIEGGTGSNFWHETRGRGYVSTTPEHEASAAET